MNLQFLFDEQIRDVQELTPGYENHASDVWLVRTDGGDTVVRASRMKGEPDNDFWWGCKKLFGIDPRQVHDLEIVNNTLNNTSSIPVPRVIRKGEASRQFVVVEKLEGRTVSSFIGQPPSVLQSLGEGLARIHLNQKRYAGNPSGTFRVELSDFHQHVITGMKQIVSSFYADHHQIAATLPDIIGGLKELPAPDSSSFVLIDIDPSQFLSDGRTITGLVDTEAYVIAPRAFDFIGLEYILDEASAAEFSIGYEKVMPLPDLTFVRLPYRYLYRLLSVQGSVDLDEWLEYKTLF
ncbi:hypothetical protein C6371_18815 [Bacillus atrophaeus]|uniref:phosphotransferase n=1 Tax=Bacillus atrophaeus TaxID=1452 RepID=UPI000D06C0DE|nr:phosphotransferase [Bacillus atrophaeus]PSA88986.1 hypothetical protein C6371_18815 [Bacillus atrophaeus]